MDYITQLEEEIAEIRKTLTEKENLLYTLKKKWKTAQESHMEPEQTQNTLNRVAANIQMENLPKWAIERYSRQILLPDIGVRGQMKLSSARVLIVGTGGLGCPAALYLAGAGVGEIGLVDYDTVDVTNIHRQVLHGEADQGMSKVESAADSLRSLNSHIKVTTHDVLLDSTNALRIISQHDIVLDCTDNVPTRYLLNDACVLSKIPLISGSALKMEGQLTVYGYRASGRTNEQDPSYIGPCYRCVFPSPPPAETVGSCSANGVAGPVPGTIGALQALEAIKYIIGKTHDKLLVQRMLLFDGEDMTFRTVKLRPRNESCAACSDNPSITKLLDYEMFCNAKAKEKDLDLTILPPENRISAPQLSKDLTDGKRHVLVDVRSEDEFKMCSIGGSVNYPIDKLRGSNFDDLVEMCSKNDRVTFICRRGNDSQIVAKNVLEVLSTEEKMKIKDLVGGLHSWADTVDSNFPVY